MSRQPQATLHKEFYVSIRPSGVGTEYQYNKPPKNQGGFNNYKASRSRKTRFFDVVNCLANQDKIDSFWTFTIPDQQTDFKNTDKKYTALFSKLLENLRVRHKRKKANGLKNYIWVAEAQKRGTIHYHLISSSYLDVTFVREKWNHLLQVDRNINNTVHVQRIQQKDIRNLSLYLAKYMSKAMQKKEYKTDSGLKERVIYAKSFNYSRNFKVFKPITLTKCQFEQIKTEILLKPSFKTVLDKATGEIKTIHLSPSVVKRLKNSSGNEVQIVQHYFDSKKTYDFIKAAKVS